MANEIVPVETDSKALAASDEQAYKAWRRKNRFIMRSGKLVLKAACDGDVAVTRYLLGRSKNKSYLMSLFDLWEYLGKPDSYKINETAYRTLLAAGAAPDAPDDSGFTPLIFCLITKHEELALETIRAGAAVNRKVSKLLPLLIAIEENMPRVVKELLAYGADPELRGGEKNENARERVLRLQKEAVDNNSGKSYQECIALLGAKEEALLMLPPKNAAAEWQVCRQGSADLVIKNTFAEEAKMLIRDIFDFANNRLLTEVHSPGKRPSLCITDFNAVSPGRIEEARHIRKNPPSLPTAQVKLT